MLKNGAPLRFPVRDARGTLLMAQGALVTERLRAILETRGITLEIQACLKLLEGGQAGLEFPITKPIFKLGRRPDCDLQLASHVVSGYHCAVYKRPAGVFLNDLTSSNGTFLNGERVAVETELNDNDEIRVGHFLFRMQIFAALAAEPGAGEKALHAWIVEEISPKQPALPYGATEPDIDLDALTKTSTDLKPTQVTSCRAVGNPPHNYLS